MFAGEFRARLEASGVCRLPPIFAAAFPPPEDVAGRQVVLLKSLDRSLWLYQAQGWDGTLTAVRARLDDEQSRLLMHYVVAESVLAVLDPHGGFAIPQAFRAYAEITTEVVFLGLYERLELWSPACWEAYVDGLDQRHEQSLGRILDLL
jgi:MraZ protein